MRNFNILYRNLDKISDTLAFPSDNLSLNETLLLGDIAMCAKKLIPMRNTILKKT